MNQRLFPQLWIGVLALGLAACAAAPTPAAPTAVVANPTATPISTATPEPAVPTTTIIQAYKTDQAAADAQYQGQTLRMTGKVTNINNVFDVMALMLRDSESEIGLQCYLADS